VSNINPDPDGHFSSGTNQEEWRQTHMKSSPLTNFTPVEERQSSRGIQHLFRFPNGWGACVEKFRDPDGSVQDAWNVTLTDRYGLLSLDLTFTNGPVINLSSQQVEDRLAEIFALPLYFSPWPQDPELVHVTIGSAYFRKSRVGVWGYISRKNDTKHYRMGCDENTTKIRMEITAALFALRGIPGHCRLVVASSLKYLVKVMTEGIEQWKMNAWKKTNGKPVKHLDLFQLLDEAASRHDVEWRLVTTGEEYGDRASLRLIMFDEKSRVLALRQ
jgi:ribonuclease HI